MTAKQYEYSTDSLKKIKLICNLIKLSLLKIKLENLSKLKYCAKGCPINTRRFFSAQRAPNI
jgi:hypothetical protein